MKRFLIAVKAFFGPAVATFGESYMLDLATQQKTEKTVSLLPDISVESIGDTTSEPIIIDGAKCSSGWGRGAKEHKFIEPKEFIVYETGERIIAEHAMDDGTDFYEEDADGVIEIWYGGCFVNHPDIWPGSESYEIFGSEGEKRYLGKPDFEWWPIHFEDCGDPERNYFYLLGFETLEWKCEEMTPAIIYKEEEGVFNRYTEPITPYEGFWPKEIIDPEVIVDPYWGPTFHFCPFQYDYQNKVVRAYKKIRFKRGKRPAGSSVATLEIPQKATYYTIDGFRVENPIKGEIYICHKDGKISKVVY